MQIERGQMNQVTVTANVLLFNSTKFAHLLDQGVLCSPHCLERLLFACGSLCSTLRTRPPCASLDGMETALSPRLQEALIANLSLLNCVNGRCTLIWLLHSGSFLLPKETVFSTYQMPPAGKRKLRLQQQQAKTTNEVSVLWLFLRLLSFLCVCLPSML